MVSTAGVGEGSAASAGNCNTVYGQDILVSSGSDGGVARRDGSWYVGRARTFAELLAAYRLVYECYVERGYITPSAEGIRVTFYNLLPNTATFVLSRRKQRHDNPPARMREHDDRLLGTVSVAIDSPEYGLPLAETFPEQLEDLRKRGRCVAEAIMLAHRPDGSKPSPFGEFQQLLMLLRCVTDYARLHEDEGTRVRDLFIQCHPHHVNFYKRKLAFEVVDGPRPCPSVRGAPAVLMHHDMDTIFERSQRLVPKASRFFLSREPDPAIRDSGYRLRGEDVIRLLALKPELWRSVARRKPACANFAAMRPDLSSVLPAGIPRVVRLAVPQTDEAAHARREAVA
ncbi:MAG TPA: hypothetical protein PLC79_02940 [Phycisphaerae bacterium]|nr:hypothetical protein [Phycisphaerae bacterium]